MCVHDLTTSGRDTLCALVTDTLGCHRPVVRHVKLIEAVSSPAERYQTLLVRPADRSLGSDDDVYQ